MQHPETGTHVSPQLQVSENSLMHTQAERLDTAAQHMTVPQCDAVCSMLTERSPALAGSDTKAESQSFGDAGRCPTRVDLKASGGLLLFMLLEERSLDGWMGEQIDGHSGES